MTDENVVDGTPYRELSPFQAFDCIKDAWLQGRPIVPLFGAGLSARAGIPVTSQLIPYLAKVKYYFDQQVYRAEEREDRSEGGACIGGGDFFKDDYRAYLVSNEWPERHQLNEELLQHFELLAEDHPARVRRRFNTPFLWVVSTVLWEEFRHVQPTVAELLHRIGSGWLDPGIQTQLTGNWRAFLRRLSEGDTVLIDSFFDRLVRARRPTTGHRFVAFLAQLMGWRLVLTTNFDTLIENALRDDGLAPVVYELPEHGPVPDHRLVRANFSLVKLHGGGFGVRVGESLDAALSEPDADAFVKYVPENSLLLVIGYGGADRRVMSLVERLLCTASSAPALRPRVLWVYRDELPTTVKRAAKQGPAGPAALHVVHYRDGELFLQELHSRLTTCHAPSAIPYRALPQVPPRTPLHAGCGSSIVVPPADFEKLEEYSVVVFHAKEVGGGTSTRLADYAKSQDNTHTVIWADLEEILTLDSLVSILLEEFRRYDFGLAPIVLHEVAGDPPKSGRDPRVDRVIEAMSRGKYLVALDSLGEFGRSHISYDPSQPHEESVEELRRAYAFLRKLIDNADQYGESKLCIAHTPLQILDQCQQACLPAEEQAKLRELQGKANREYADFLEFLRQCQPSHKVHLALSQTSFVVPLVGEASKDHIRPLLAQGFTPEALIEELKKAGGSLSEALQVFWARLHPDYKKILALASAFRRPRSIVALRRLCAILIANPCTDLMHVLNGLSPKTAAMAQSSIDDRVCARVDRLLENLTRLPFLVPQEGGFYWMHRGVRDEVYRRLDRECPSGMANVHDLLATYYYEELFRPSSDLAAYFEYVFHRVASIRQADPALLNDRLRELWVCLQRERERLVEQRHAGMLLRWIRGIRDYELRRCNQHLNKIATKGEAKKHRKEFQALERQLRQSLCDLEAGVLREATAFDSCIALRLRQARDRLVESDFCSREGIQAWISRYEQWNGDENPTDVPQLLGALRAIVGQLAREFRPECADAEARRLFRLIEHVLDIGVCLKGLSNYGEACETIRVASRSLQLLEPNLPVSLKERACGVQIRCSFRLMDLHLNEMDPWHPPDDDALKTLAEKEYHKARDRLRVYAERNGYEYSRYNCYLASQRARLAYIRRNFSQAYQFLDAARAAVYRTPASRQQIALAVCYLHQAECLMLHSRHGLDSKARDEWTGNQLATHTPGEPHLTNVAKAKLDRAQEALILARDILITSRKNVWWWTWMYLLNARLQHEYYALSLVVRSDGEQERHRQQYLLDGLRAIGAGLDNIFKHERRRDHFAAVWWQFVLAMAIEEEEESLDLVWERWQRLNDKVRLTWFLQEQESRRGRFSSNLCALTKETFHANRSRRETLLACEKFTFPVSPAQRGGRPRHKTGRGSRQTTPKRAGKRKARRSGRAGRA